MLQADIDGDGIPDIRDVDGDGVLDVPEGEPGDRDIEPNTAAVVTAVSGQLDSVGLAAVAEDDDGSELLFQCSGMAMSFDDGGAMVDWAIGIPSGEGGGPAGQLIDLYPPEDAGQRAFTKDNPFLVKHRVVYFGRLPGEGDGPIDHNWSIDTGGISLDSGGDDNPDANNRNAGEVNIDDVPGGSLVLPSGIFPVGGELSSANGVRCEGSGWVQFDTGNPLLSVGGIAGGLAIIAGGLGLLFNARPAVTWKA